MQCFCNPWRVRNLLEMLLRLNKSLKLAELIPTADCSGPASTFVHSYHERFSPCLSLTMLQKTPFRCSEFSCRKKFTSDSWPHKHIKLHQPEHLQVARQKNLTIHSAPRHVDPAQRPEFIAKKDSVEDLDVFPYLEQHENIVDSESQPPPPPLPVTEIYSRASALLSNHIAEPWEREAHRCLETTIQNNPYFPFVMHEKYKNMQCGIKKKGMKMYYDNVLKEENTTLHFPSFKNGDLLQNVLASMSDDQALGEWKLHTLEDMKWNDNDQCPIKYWSRDIIESMGCLMRQPAYVKYLVYATQNCFNSNTPPKRLYTEIQTADW